MKSAIIYYSKHHNNTKKVLDSIAKDNDITLIDASKTNTANLEEYDLIGFSSGIYYSKFHKSVLRFAENNLPPHKNVFFVYTCGAEKIGYTSIISEIALKKSSNILGEYGCLGYDTFGPFKLVGGIAKDHPNNSELKNASHFYKKLVSRIQ